MCRAQERPQRRHHRAVYLAPSAVQMQQQVRADLGEQGIPLLLEVPTDQPQVASPPSSGELSIDMYTMIAAQKPPLPIRRRIWRGIRSLYNWFVDALLLVVVCCMGFFFYDFEVKMVKTDRHRARTRGRSGRVIIRTNEPGMTTSLLRTPPQTGTLASRSSSEPHWDYIV